MKVWEILKKENIGKKYKWLTKTEDIIVEVKESIGIGVALVNEESGTIPLCVAVLSTEFEEIKPDAGWGREYGKGFYSISETNYIEKHYGDYEPYDNKVYNNCNMFSTKEKAEEVAKEQLLYRIIKRFRDENDKYVDWMNNCGWAFYIYYDSCDKEYNVSMSYDERHLHTIYFTTRELATKCLNEVVLPFIKNNKQNL